jgi:transcription-repair coupling factor (superfamily II helicase)
VPAYIPEDYVPGDSQRLVWYKRLSQVRDQEDAASLREEMLDRNGPRPEPVENLFQVMEVKALVKKLRARALEYNGKALVLDLGKEAKLDPDRIVDRITREPKKYRLTPDQKLHYFIRLSEQEQLFQEAKNLLNSLL